MATKRKPSTDAPAPDERPPWPAFADALIQQEALIARLGRGAPPQEFAGLCVGEENSTG